MIKPASVGYLFLLFLIKKQKVVIDFLLVILYGPLAGKVTFLQQCDELNLLPKEKLLFWQLVKHFC
ncbi:hypothetical protein KVR801_200217 [Klebsiella variicola]|nr:hypothetical protein DMT39_19385 [Klebsiella variicola]CEL85548.1 hypothetical protein KVR801_200217 [Klebsiella variicola]